MKSRLSEFSYGFALVNEQLASLGRLAAAPVFPSLIEEGRRGGGYDVKLEKPGPVLQLQFKRSDYLSLPTAREYKAGAGIGLPYHRMRITAARDSEQHAMLLALDLDPAIVFYAAPCFYEIEQFNTAYLHRTVRQWSFFTRPRDIGIFVDNEAHHACFDGTASVVCSKPRKVRSYRAEEIDDLLSKRLRVDDRPFGEGPLEEAVAVARAARERYVVDRAARQARGIAPTIAEEQVDEPGDSTRSRIPKARTDPLAERRDDGGASSRLPARATALPGDPAQAALQALAEIGLQQFNAQVFVVQDRDEP